LERTQHTPRAAWIAQLVDARPGEGPSIAWATLYFFLLLCVNYLLRPVREALGIARGADQLPLVWTGTLAVSLLVQPAFAALIARLPRRRFLPIVYHASVLCLLGFRAAFRFAPESWQGGLGYAFYIWFSVFNLFAVSVFWGFAADLFRLEQAKRLFGFLSVGGTLGAVAGSALAGSLSPRIGSLQMLLVACVLLELAVVCVHALAQRHAVDTPRERGSGALEPPPQAQPSPWRGLSFVLQRGYLQKICAFTLFYTLFNTILYFQQANLVEGALSARDERVGYFATVDFAGNVLTLLLQLFVTGRVIRRLGVGFALVTQPVLAGSACLGLGLMIWKGAAILDGPGWPFAWPPVLVSVAAARVLLAASNYATAKPARESLYTVVERDVKYASKSFVDTFVYRAGDLIGAWSFHLLREGLALSLAAIALGAAPLALVWLAFGLALGREQSALAHADAARRDAAGS
jgi:AAA family ATP:ADP antiporter